MTRLTTEQLEELLALRKAMKVAEEGLDTSLNYLNWRADDLVGDDLIGDQRLTKGFNEKVKALTNAQAKISELLKGWRE